MGDLGLDWRAECPHLEGAKEVSCVMCFVSQLALDKGNGARDVGYIRSRR